MNVEVVRMTTIQVFDPPMCCSTGVCGPSVDPALATFVADLGWLSKQGVVVERHNLSQEPGAFTETDLVRALLTERGDEALPAIVVDGALRCAGRYPSRAELEGWALRRSSEEDLDALTTELVAIGAATDTAVAGTSSGECCGGPSSELDVDAASPPGAAVKAAGGCCGGPAAREAPFTGVGATEGSGSGCCG